MDAVMTPRCWIQVHPCDGPFPLAVGVMLYPAAIPAQYTSCYLPADGRLIAKAEYPDLYAMAPKGRWPYGETETHFYLPDARM